MATSFLWPENPPPAGLPQTTELHGSRPTSQTHFLKPKPRAPWLPVPSGQKTSFRRPSSNHRAPWIHAFLNSHHGYLSEATEIDFFFPLVE
ncbi:hypothetical protein TIFTF001_021700 [Ficus carica]|uniref:Uncharacterized protein n=1 Tax=Ficus carica TaxID=3494 RepID=A0AA88DJU9_FICCA|nr:hypothetical protein TIFTF001_021700 [Ficus carica]